MRDVIIVGAGMAALISALTIAKEKNVKLFTKNFRSNGNSWRAQGGIAVAIHESDTPTEHLQDTLSAGCYHNDPRMVSILVSEGISRVRRWMEEGMTFDSGKNGELDFGMEGAHGKRRVLHAGGDQTGFHWMTFLHEQILAHSNIEIVEDEYVIDLIMNYGKCDGIFTKSKDGSTKEHYSLNTILATGGCGGLFEATSNDPSIIGDGIAMAYRAGARVADLEFLQFHPTLIVYKGRVIGLASEALRGEGAILVSSDGRAIMEGIDSRKELAPRDVVARVIERETNAGNQVFLDISSIQNFETRFPAIYKMCIEGGIPILHGRIPVSIGAHFLMGGVVTDSNGKTSVPGLYAVGEVARTGVHGANRLASNSLLEALVFGERTGEFIRDTFSDRKTLNEFTRPFVKVYSSEEPNLPPRDEIQKRVTLALGVEREQKTLERFIDWLNEWDVSVLIQRERYSWSREGIECSNMLITSWLMATAALEREESRGAHYRTDYPNKNSIFSCGKQIMRQLKTRQMTGRELGHEQTIT
ncbi:L-aspartate oxidase [Evansella tamaricis]|uniref:L-aspartate oxidase n=1 Tax=Evansella tamaricis TaxID=2069301 RepID=A0ABS6JM98_9BACI|nr:L-aspartate oxidase [Evansella tamaricis]MBU9714801.1 L-aspartate oxidase [Evansella tamaricis]